MKYLLLFIGFLAVALAALGLFLPLLPTTPFLLLAAACFARASPRLHTALLKNRAFGPYLYDFQVHRGLTLRTKLTALTMLWASLVLSMLAVTLTGLRVLLALIGLGVSLYLILGLKTLKVSKPGKQAATCGKTTLPPGRPAPERKP